MNIDIDVSKVALTTDRLLLRPWRLSDLEDFYEYASVDGVGQMAGWKPHESREESLEILHRFIAGKRTFALEYGGKVIGSLGIEEYKEERFPELAKIKCRELGFALSKDYWGQELMAEAVREVIRYLFADVGVDAILCRHYVNNRQSARVQEKCGFRYYTFGRSETRMGTTKDDVVNLLTREVWSTMR